MVNKVPSYPEFSLAQIISPGVFLGSLRKGIPVNRLVDPLRLASRWTPSLPLPRQDRPMPFPSPSGMCSPSLWPLWLCVVSCQLPAATCGPAEGLVSLWWDCGLCPGRPHLAESPHYLHSHLCPWGHEAVGGWLSQGTNVP